MALGQLGKISSLAPQAGLALKELAIGSPGPARLIGAAFWLLLALLVAAPSALRSRKAPSTPRMAFAALMLMIAAGDAVGIWSTLRLLSRWLLFQGM
jgi:hypothetical protein